MVNGTAPVVGMVLTTYGNSRAKHFKATLESMKLGGLPLRIVVVCNEAPDATTIALQNDVEAILYKTKDSGFSHSINMGLNYFKTTSVCHDIQTPIYVGYSCDDILYKEGWLAETMRMWQDIDDSYTKAGIISPHDSTQMERQIKVKQDRGFYYFTNYASGTVYLIKWSWLNKLMPNGLLSTAQHIGQEDWDLLLANEKQGYGCAILKKGWATHFGLESMWNNSGNVLSQEVTREEYDRIIGNV